jgi:hypothetical protein
MGEVVRFIPKSELERIRLAREARALYESVFPTATTANEQRHTASTSRAIGNANAHRRDDQS